MQRCSLWLLPLMILAACALWEEPPSESTIPLTLQPEPTLFFSGECDNNRELADWLQYSTYYVEQFTELVTTTAAGNKPSIRAGVVEIATLREEYAQIVTPDCAEPGQRMFFGAMNRSIDTFQRYINGEINSIGNLLPEVLGEIDRIHLVQDELRTRLDTQLEQSAADE